PKIQDIVVVGIKDSIRDEAIKAFVVLNEGETLSEEEFFRFCFCLPIYKPSHSKLQSP
ncbi:hypothetical protein OHE72_23885, partial [Escherichia coli]